MSDQEVRAAVEAIDAFLVDRLPAVDPSAPPLDGSVHIHTTDGGDVVGEWLVQVDDLDTYVLTREHAKGSCALRGRAADLLDVLWRRQPLSAVEVIGDADVARRFVSRTRLP